MNIIEHPHTTHPEPYVMVSMCVEDKTYPAYWNNGWYVDFSQFEEDFKLCKEEENLGRWINWYPDNPEKHEAQQGI